MAESGCSAIPLAGYVILGPAPRHEDAWPLSVYGMIIRDDGPASPRRGLVLAAGPGPRLEDGSFAEAQVKAGDEVSFAPYADCVIKVGDVNYLIMKEDCILAVFV